MAVTTPTHYWELGEATGSDRADSIGSLEMVPVNAPTQQFAYKGFGCHFTRASSQYLQNTDDPSTGDIDFAFSCVVFADSLTAGQTIIGKDNGTVFEFQLFYSGTGGGRFGFYVENGGSGNVVYATAGANAAERYMITCWHDATNDEIGIQINDEAPDTVSYSGGMADTGHALRIGARGDGQYWDGTIENVAWWKNYIPDSTELSELWSDGAMLTLQQFAAGTITPVTIYANNGTGAQGYESWPALLALSNTSMFCGLTDASSHIADDAIVKGFISTDEGATWGSMVTVASEVSTACGVNPGAIFNDVSVGNILCSHSRQSGGSILAPKIRRSTDSGATWGAWATLAVPSGYNWIFPYGKFTRIGDDLYKTFYGEVTSTGYWNALLMISPDNGLNWTIHGVIAAGDASLLYSETDAVHTSGSNWLAVSREENTPGIFYTTSTDGGATWAATTQLTTPVSNPTPSYLYKIDDNRIHLFYGSRNLISTNNTIVNYFTPDGGTTFYGPSFWTLPLSIASPIDFGYPSPMGVNGTLKFAYYKPGTSGTDVVFQSTYMEVPLIFPDGGGPWLTYAQMRRQ